MRIDSEFVEYFILYLAVKLQWIMIFLTNLLKIFFGRTTFRVEGKNGKYRVAKIKGRKEKRETGGKEGRVVRSHRSSRHCFSRSKLP